MATKMFTVTFGGIIHVVNEHTVELELMTVPAAPMFTESFAHFVEGKLGEIEGDIFLSRCEEYVECRMIREMISITPKASNN